MRTSCRQDAAETEEILYHSGSIDSSKQGEGTRSWPNTDSEEDHFQPGEACSEHRRVRGSDPKQKIVAVPEPWLSEEISEDDEKTSKSERTAKGRVRIS